jgi:hypothetical protein
LWQHLAGLAFPTVSTRKTGGWEKLQALTVRGCLPDRHGFPPSFTLAAYQVSRFLQRILMTAPTAVSNEAVIDMVRAWLEKAVIGLNLCPFAKSVYIRSRVRFVVSDATEPEALAEDLMKELSALHAADPKQVDTTLLIHPRVLQDFSDYNDFLGIADTVLDEMGLTGELQVASFHPDYQFAGTRADDITNYTNRSPFPILHLLRESSIEAAIATYPDTDEIYQNNMETLRRLGLEGWNKLGIPSDRK